MSHRDESVRSDLQLESARQSMEEDVSKKPNLQNDNPEDPFGEEVEGQMQYKTLSWWYVNYSWHLGLSH